MNTRIVQVVDPEKSHEEMREASDLIRSGQLVAFPTETVYGLGANAFSTDAVGRIFKAKGRPGDNPLIVHIDNMNTLELLAVDIPKVAYSLMEAFWPGPLTMVLKKATTVPKEVTAGLSTVAIRMPNHPIARALIRQSGLPIAAPSANRSGRPSPTSASHVIADMLGRIPLILDGGRAMVGLESTVLDLTGSIPMILRPGGVTVEMLREVVGKVGIDSSILTPLKEGQEVRSPGLKYSHYAPRAQVIILRGSLDKLVLSINQMVLDYIEQGKRVGILATDETKELYSKGVVLSMGSRMTPAVLATNLFDCLLSFDGLDIDVILAEGVDSRDEGLAVMNRMVRAAGFHIIDV